MKAKGAMKMLMNARAMATIQAKGTANDRRAIRRSNAGLTSFFSNPTLTACRQINNFAVATPPKLAAYKINAVRLQKFSLNNAVGNGTNDTHNNSNKFRHSNPPSYSSIYRKI